VIDIYEAAGEVHEWLMKRGVPHYFIGGLAVHVWGEPRQTRDVDVCVVVKLKDAGRLRQELLDSFQPKFEGAAEIAAALWVCPLVTESGVPFDVSFAVLGPERDMLQRATEVDVGTGRTLPVCCAEDLVVYKAVADRGKDASDLRSVLARQCSRLDVAVIRERLELLCAAIDDNGPLQRFEQVWQQHLAETEE